MFALAPLSPSHIVLWTIGITLAFELLTCLFRFGFKMQSSRDTASTIGVCTLGIRVHHSYIGLLLLLGVSYLRLMPWLEGWMIVTGASMVASDLIHHFLVLWPITGSPEFDLVYGRTEAGRDTIALAFSEDTQKS